MKKLWIELKKPNIHKYVSCTPAQIHPWSEKLKFQKDKLNSIYIPLLCVLNKKQNDTIAEEKSLLESKNKTVSLYQVAYFSKYRKILLQSEKSFQEAQIHEK